MEVTFSPDLERFIDLMVSKGEYPTREDVVRAGVAQMRGGEEGIEADREKPRAMVQVGIDDLKAGRSRDGEEVLRDLYARHAARFPNEASEAA